VRRRFDSGRARLGFGDRLHEVLQRQIELIGMKLSQSLAPRLEALRLTQQPTQVIVEFDLPVALGNRPHRARRWRSRPTPAAHQYHPAANQSAGSRAQHSTSQAICRLHGRAGSIASSSEPKNLAYCAKTLK
jgi:hypothetical protein